MLLTHSVKHMCVRFAVVVIALIMTGSVALQAAAQPVPAVPSAPPEPEPAPEPAPPSPNPAPVPPPAADLPPSSEAPSDATGGTAEDVGAETAPTSVLPPPVTAAPAAPADPAPVAGQAPVVPAASAPPVSPASVAPLQPTAAAVPAQAPVTATSVGSTVTSSQPDPRMLAAIEGDAEDERAPAEPDESETHCLLGTLCLGPVGTVGLLDVIGIGGQARTDHWGVGIDYQFIHFTAQGIPITLSLLTVEGRLYPFAGSFFLAGGLAWQHASLSGTVSYQADSDLPPIEAEVSGKVDIPVLKLGIGWFGRSGFVVGFDLAFGVQLGGNTVEFGTDLPRIDEVVQTEQKIRDRADTWVRKLPFLLQLNVIRLGFLF